MIVSFRDAETEKVSAGVRSRRLPPGIQSPARRKLRLVEAAESLDDLRQPPGNRLERLTRDRAGQWSIRINDQWRVCFRWINGGAHDVEIVDYHR